jgi:hypothetical protein
MKTVKSLSVAKNWPKSWRKTLLELISAQEIIKFLYEGGSSKHTGCESTGGRKLLRDEMPVEVERNESDQIQITTGRFERSRKPAIKHA